jgi:beta-mannosidase
VRARVEGHDIIELMDGWEAAACAPGEHVDAGMLATLDWRPAPAATNAAAVLAAEGVVPWEIAAEQLDGQDWWFRTSFQLPESSAEVFEETVLDFEGLATVAEVYLNGALIHDRSSMFARSCVEVGGALAPSNELAICCRALTPLLALSRKPRARWRTRVVSDGGLRFFRTMLLGRAPGFAPGPAVVGPWRPVRLERRGGFALEELELRPRVAGSDGVLSVRALLRSLGDFVPERASVELDGGGRAGSVSAELELLDGELRGELVVGDVALWWPHTHGEPSLYTVRVVVEGSGQTRTIDAGRVGFRSLVGGGERLEADGLALAVNGEEVFARGALWTPPEALGLAASAYAAAIESQLRALRDAGMNMVRLAGVGLYESAAFHDLCDELGILVWQDFMFANLDYPESDVAFLAAVAAEARQLLGEVGGRPSLAVLCGSSEVAQQVAMMGLDPSLAEGPLFGELLPELVAQAGVDAVYVPSAPWGGDLPFRPDRGVANYYGVGAYLLPLSDARASGVLFAAECLAFANVPEPGALTELGAGSGAPTVNTPAWKAGVARDVGASWDFDDVRDHYLQELYGIDPAALLAVDEERYLELSRALSGEVMAEVFGEWRRGASPCRGGLVLWLRDLRPGAGWGILDHHGTPKATYHHLRRALAPLAVWSTDEGLSGIDVHVANDGADPVRARLRVALYSDFELRVEQIERELELEPHSSWSGGVEALIGRFVDVSWSYRFGPPAQDLVALSLEDPGVGGAEPFSQAFRFPLGRPLKREAPERLGLTATLASHGERAWDLRINSRRFAYCVRVNVPGFSASDDAFSVEPGGGRTIRLTGLEDGATPAGTLSALNLSGHVPITSVGQP